MLSFFRKGVGFYAVNAAKVTGDSITDSSFEGIGTDRLTRTVATRRIGTPEDCARVVGFLAGPDSDYLTGAIIPIDGGSTT